MPHPRYQLFITVQIFFRRCEAAVFLCVMSMGDAVAPAPSLPAFVVMKYSLVCCQLNKDDLPVICRSSWRRRGVRA